ncbi:hypothetical protein AB0G85_00885 [Streptomyces sioyaensis]
MTEYGGGEPFGFFGVRDSPREGVQHAGDGGGVGELLRAGRPDRS